MFRARVCAALVCASCATPSPQPVAARTATSVAAPPPDATPRERAPVEPVESVPAASPEPAESPPRSFSPTLAMRCWSTAMEKLGWLAAGAHTGQFVKTASDAGLLPPECKPLGSDTFESGFPLDGGGTLQWSREKELR
ncbi:MAG TPA: hypothetical protein PKD61_09085, partial [Polyangiaceae bacterium]|nr:hypothetical protein [Polyangiaceae bacterium]